MPRAAIDFIWPFMLWVLLAVPVMMVYYQRMVAKREQAAQAYSRLEIIGTTPGANSALRRKLPPWLMLGALVLFILALARPEAAVILPSRTDAIILAMDVSGSMRADDVKPNRLKAAQEAALAFINEQPKGVRVGIVEIASSAALVLAPTTDHEALEKAINEVQLQKGTALGTGMVVALAALLPAANIDVDQLISGRPGQSNARPLGERDKDGQKPVPPGSNASTAIVLLSDGGSNVGPDPVKIAEFAAEKGVRVYTVGVGTPEGATLKIDGFSVRVRMEEEVLKKIAMTTNGDFFRAATAKELKKIYENLAMRLAMEKQQAVEVSALCAALGALLALLSGFLSMLWFNRIL